MADSTVDARVRRVRLFDAFIHPTSADQALIDDVWTYLGQYRHPVTRAGYFAHLKAWFTWLHTVGHRQDNPLAGIRAPRIPRAEPRPVADAHLAALMAGGHYRRTRVMILLAALAGLRVHEIAKVAGEDVDLTAGTISVVGKGGVRARLPLHPMLRIEAERMPRTGWWFPARASRRDPQAGHIHGRSVSDVIRLAMRRAGIPGSAHSLRHWFGTNLLRSGADLRTTQTLLRHASVATTQMYTQVAEPTRTAAIARLEIAS